LPISAAPSARGVGIAAPAAARGNAGANAGGNSGNGGNGGSRKEASDYHDDGYSSGSQSDNDENEIWEKSSDHAEDEDEDMCKRELELKAELDMATMRCEELKRTLQATKSFVDPKIITSSRKNSLNAPAPAFQKPAFSTLASGNENEDYDDLEEDDDEDASTVADDDYSNNEEVRMQ
jgi:hypothetical protein